MPPIKIISSATSDLATDQRIHRINKSLINLGFEVLVVGRKFKKSLTLSQREYKSERMNLFFSKGMFFYIEYNFRLFFKLLFSKVDILYSNDLDTLLANTLVSKIKGLPLIYDSHEYFTEVPELVDRPKVKSIWQRIESFCMPSVDLAFTVSESIARAYREKYDKEFIVLRNLPETYNLQENRPVDLPEFGGKKVILYQGSVNVDRGLEEIIDAMAHLEGFVLLIIGDGDVFDDLNERVSGLSWKKRIHFAGRIPFEDLSEYTALCHLGISIEKANGLSYTYAMPNKLFDYIQAGIPSLISDLPEMKKLNDHYKFGTILQDHKPETIAKQIKEVLDDEALYAELKNNALKAGLQLNWEKECEVLNSTISDFLGRA